MEILRAKTMGYCMGVKRAIEMAEKALDQYPNKKGLKVLESEKINEFEGENSVVIIRAHGISPKMRRLLEEKGSIVLDATCPRVLSSQKRASSFSSKGYIVIIAGDKNHGEVNGIEGFVFENGQKCIVLENEEQAKNFIPNKDEIYVVLSQTTFSEDEYHLIVEELKSKILDLTVLNTICSATEERQEALHSLCKKCDNVLVIGGKESANTRRLFEIALEHTKDENFRVQNAFYLEDVFEFQKVKNNIEENCVLGLTAGASTPEESVLLIEESLQN